MTLGLRYYCFMKKTRGQKSHASVPLTITYSILFVGGHGAMTGMGYEGGGVYPGHYYGGCEDTRQHSWGGYHQQVAHPQGSPSQRYPYYDTRYM